MVCPQCRDGLVHRLTLLHAGADSLVLCCGAWESLPSWLRDSFGQVKKGTPVGKRREVVREIREHLQSE